MLLREYKYTLHPSRAGSCVTYHALAAVDRRLPNCSASCEEILRHTGELGHYMVPGGEHQESVEGGDTLPLLPPRTGHAKWTQGACLTDGPGVTLDAFKNKTLAAAATPKAKPRGKQVGGFGKRS